MAIENLTNIMRRIKEEGLIADLGEQNLTSGQRGVDLRLGKVYELVREIESRLEVDGWKEVSAIRKRLRCEYSDEEDGQASPYFVRGKYYLIETIESIKVPDDLMPEVFINKRLVEAGFQLQIPAEITRAGFAGPLVMGLVNSWNIEDRPQIYMGVPICHLIFHKIEGQ